MHSNDTRMGWLSTRPTSACFRRRLSLYNPSSRFHRGCVGQEQWQREVGMMQSYLRTEKIITVKFQRRRHRWSSPSCSSIRREGGVVARRWQCRLLLLAVALTAMASCRRASASSNPLELNGGSCLAMAGKGCVALAVDRRFGLEGQLVSADAKRVLKINGQLLCGFTGLWTDVLTVMQDLSFEVALKRLAEEGRPISPAALAGLLSTLLYSRRGSPFFVEPIVAGLSAGGKPYLCGQDILGAPVEVDDFVVAGTSAQSLYGTCEAFFKEGMEPEELFRAASRCLLSALERDCLSGYGAVVHIITDEGIETRELTTRMD